MRVAMRQKINPGRSTYNFNPRLEEGGIELYEVSVEFLTKDGKEAYWEITREDKGFVIRLYQKGV